MASLNLSINGASIKSSYNGVINGPALSSSSPTYGQWALFSVQAPLMNAFQDSSSKESILKVESTGDGELPDLIEDFSEGRMQFAFVKVKDPNTGLPKYVLIAWCGGGVPERTKGYFTSHLAAVAKILHGYHVQITARSDSDLEPEAIMRKVADASGSKYSAGTSDGAAARAPPPVKSKPVFTPTMSSAGRVNPIVAARSKRDENVDADGWGADAPPVTRTQVEKVESAYKPTKVNMGELTKNKPEPSRLAGAPQPVDDGGDVVRGGYQPVGKVDIAAIRAQAKKTGDDRPTPVKGAYEPVGKVDIAAIRARSQKPADEEPASPEPAEPKPAPLADRAAAFSKPAESERLTSMPKPKVANKFGGSSGFTGTKAPTPGAFGLASPSVSTAAPVSGTTRTFADSGGKTPAQLWAEKKAKERGGSAGVGTAPSVTSPVTSQTSGGNEWKSGYAGKSWAPVTTGGYGKDAVSEHNTGEPEEQAEEAPSSPSGGVSALRDRFKGTAPMGSMERQGEPQAARDEEEEDEPAPPPVPAQSRPSGAFALPGLPSRPVPAEEEEEEMDPSAYEPERDTSPARIAVPVSRGADPPLGTPEERQAPPPVALSQIPVPREEEIPDDDEADQVARGASNAVAEQTFEPETVAAGQAAPQAVQGGHRAVIQYDYERAEENEIDLVEGEYVTNIEMVDEDWWMGTNGKGHSGLFPSNYVELVEDGDEQSHAAPPPAPMPAAAEPAPVAEPEPAPAGGKPTATALYDYEAAEDNEISFPEDAKVTNLEFPDEDWWFGEYGGKKGLFPANYVQLDS